MHDIFDFNNNGKLDVNENYAKYNLVNETKDNNGSFSPKPGKREKSGIPVWVFVVWGFIIANGVSGLGSVALGVVLGITIIIIGIVQNR